MNIDLPINLVKVAQNLNIKICTFGTIQEEFKTRNNYLDSKRAMIEVLAGEIDRGYHLHLRLHTVYGARKPKYHMFLSKLSQAITSKTPFRMSSGLQLREFHHVTDDVRAIIAVNSSQVTGIEEINSGKEFRLRDFAAAILENYSLEHLLELNVFKDPVHENYKIRFPINRLTEKINFRDPVSGFIKHHDEINPDL